MTFQYDQLNRLTLKTLPGGATVSYNYDAVTGYLTGVTSLDISYTFAYDSAGRLAIVSDSRGYSLAYSYNALGQRTQTTLPGGQTVTYNYDAANRLQTLISQAGSFTFGYDSAERRNTLTYPNGLTANYSFDANDRLTGLVYGASGIDLLNIAYPSHDKIGNRLARSEDGQVTSYGYDQLYQLLTATGPEGSENYSYDPVGNRESGPTVKDTAEVAYDHNDVHQMIRGRKFGYNYDANGNQTARLLTGGKTWTQSWDAENQLKQVQWQNGADSRTVTFKYDPFGRRIGKQTVDTLAGSTATKTVSYVYDGEDIVLQKEDNTQNGATTTAESRYLHGPGIDEPLALTRNGQHYYYHADGLGSIVALTDSGKNLVQRYNYESFGLPMTLDPNFEQPYAFTGREWDREIGLYYYRARYYDPMEGRFISKDPIGFAGGDVNVYRYVGNNASSFVDPFGLKCEKTAGKRVGEVGVERKVVGKILARLQYFIETLLPQPSCKISGIDMDMEVVPYDKIINTMEGGWRSYHVEISYYEMQQETYSCEVDGGYMEAYGKGLDKVYLYNENIFFKYNGPHKSDSLMIDGKEIFPYVKN